MMEDLGFSDGRIIEGIVTTYNADLTPNAAPMGMSIDGSGRIILNVHEGSDTQRNVSREEVLCANMVYDPYIFLASALRGHGDRGRVQELSDEEFGDCTEIRAPYLQKAAVFIEMEVDSKSKKLKRDQYGEKTFYRYKCRILKINIIDSFPKGYNRGLGAAIELAIELSRGKKDNVDKYLEIIQKTMKNKEYRKIKGLLKDIR